MVSANVPKFITRQHMLTLRIPPQRQHRRMLHQQQRMADPARLARRNHAVPEIEPMGVRDAAYGYEVDIHFRLDQLNSVSVETE